MKKEQMLNEMFTPGQLKARSYYLSKLKKQAIEEAYKIYNTVSHKEAHRFLEKAMNDKHQCLANYERDEKLGQALSSIEMVYTIKYEGIELKKEFKAFIDALKYAMEVYRTSGIGFDEVAKFEVYNNGKLISTGKQLEHDLETRFMRTFYVVNEETNEIFFETKKYKRAVKVLDEFNDERLSIVDKTHIKKG